MTDVIAGKNITGASWEIRKVNNLGPADQEENPANQPPGEMREKSLGEGHVEDAELRSCSSSAFK